MECKLGMIAVGALILASSVAKANEWITIPDASQLFYQTSPDSKVFLRNLNSFDSHAQGCCYNYYVDLTTEEGKALFALLLTSIARGSSLWLSVPDGYASGAVSFGDYWVN